MSGIASICNGNGVIVERAPIFLIQNGAWIDLVGIVKLAGANPARFRQVLSWSDRIPTKTAIAGKNENAKSITMAGPESRLD
jgi:hypothetical protein